MKNFLISQALWFALAGMLAGGIYYQSAGLLNLGMAAIWVLCLGAAFAAVVLIGVCTKMPDAGDALKGAVADPDVVRALRTLSMQGGMSRFTLNAVQSLATFMLAAYAGMLVTAVLYGAVTLTVVLVQLHGRERLNQYEAECKERGIG